MKDLKGTKTEKNLITALTGESCACVKYQYYASKAKKEGYEQISAIFTETSLNEKEHAKLWFKLLHNGVPATSENLKDAIGGENYEWTTMYEQMAEEAKEEGFDDIANTMLMVGEIEKHHENRFSKLLKAIEENTAFTQEEETVWICRNCGHIHHGKSAPEVCPVCDHSRAYFERFKENY